MIPLGILPQIYIVAASIGIIFVLANVAMGQLEGGDDASGDFSGDGDGGGDYSGDGGDAGDGGGDYTPDSGPSHSGKVMGTALARGTHGGTGFGGMLLGLLSPMTISLYLAAFGVTGVVLTYAAPWLGVITLAIAVVVSLVTGAIYKSMIRWMMRNMHTSSHSKESDIIGQLAQVNTPIQGDRLGEVTFVVQSKRINATAKPAQPGLEFKKGSQVLIVGKSGPVVLVEPCQELEDQFSSK